MSNPSSSAQAQLRGLANRLRDLRVDAGLTGVGLAADLGWHQSKVSRIENAIRPPSIADVQAWCRACGADHQAADLVDALRTVEDAYVQWQRLQRAGLRRLQESYVPLHERTRLMRVYSSQLIPGMVQTRDYVTALLDSMSDAPNDVPEAADARVARQRRLHEGGHRFAFVLEQSVLRRSVGGPEVMAGQLRHLLAVMSLPSVSLGIVPVDADLPQWPVEMFTMYDDAEVRVELLSALITITAPSEIRLYTAAFANLASMAVYGHSARDLITSALADFDIHA
ncbi:MAG: helix-turn-helix domain-containing protein [Streptosporangiales bacterium]|nr:helix-turn-helix domain-containing protein [Streptosporangiales bacterium]